MPLWTPDDLAVAPYFWLDPSDAATVTQSSGRVSQLDDKSGNARHATQATGGNQPLITAAAIGGLAALLHDSSRADRMDGSASITGAQCAVFAVLQHSTATNQYARPFSFARAATFDNFDNGTFGCERNFNSDTMHIIRNGSASGEMPWVDDTPFQVGVTWSGTTGTLYDDGTPHATTVANSSNFNITQWRIGASVQATTGPNEHWDGYIGEIIFLGYNPTTDEREQIEGYLAHKWGVAGSLPIGHTYKSAAPTTGVAAQLVSVKHAGVWKPATVSVKHAGVWKQPTVSVKHSGTWKQP